MPNKVMTVSAVLTPEQRALVIQRFTPSYPDVFAFQLTWAYRATPQYVFPQTEIELCLDGIHVGELADAATGWLHDGVSFHHERFRPDGKPVHVTLSTSSGASPAEGGKIDRKAIRLIGEPLLLRVRLALRHATTLRPQRLAA